MIRCAYICILITVKYTSHVTKALTFFKITVTI